MLQLTQKGLFCEAGDFYIDPMRAVDTALITHAHSDHARAGSRQYLCTRTSVGVLAHRIGHPQKIRGVEFRERFKLGSVWVSFHPAGHILGSAQIRIEDSSGDVWVVSGDYKRESDASCEPFEIVPCNTFVTEATFGKPSYRWTCSQEVMDQIFDWWSLGAASGRNSILYCYALGKTQRVLAELFRCTQKRVLIFGEAVGLTECYRREGIQMVPTQDIDLLAGQTLEGELILAPHSFNKSPWITRLGNPQTAFASGWMRRGVGGASGGGFALSDHADWPGLIRTIQETGAKRVLVQHGKDGALTRTLRKQGCQAAILTKKLRPTLDLPVQESLF